MRTDTLETPNSRMENGRVDTVSVSKSLMTPARRAALDALEREFAELLAGERKVA